MGSTGDEGFGGEAAAVEADRKAMLSLSEVTAVRLVSGVGCASGLFATGLQLSSAATDSLASEVFCVSGTKTGEGGVT